MLQEARVTGELQEVGGPPLSPSRARPLPAGRPGLPPLAGQQCQVVHPLHRRLTQYASWPQRMWRGRPWWPWWPRGPRGPRGPGSGVARCGGVVRWGRPRVPPGDWAHVPWWGVEGRTSRGDVWWPHDAGRPRGLVIGELVTRENWEVPPQERRLSWCGGGQARHWAQTGGLEAVLVRVAGLVRQRVPGQGERSWCGPRPPSPPPPGWRGGARRAARPRPRLAEAALLLLPPVVSWQVQIMSNTSRYCLYRLFWRKLLI